MSNNMPFDLTDRCEICKFSNLSSLEWFCRRQPPVVVPTEEAMFSMFPYTQPDSWCGEYQLDRDRSMALQKKHFEGAKRFGESV